LPTFQKELSSEAEPGKDRFIYRLLDLVETELKETGDRKDSQQLFTIIFFFYTTSPSAQKFYIFGRRACRIRIQVVSLTQFSH
jgi:hypothetical protein